MSHVNQIKKNVEGLAKNQMHYCLHQSDNPLNFFNFLSKMLHFGVVAA